MYTRIHILLKTGEHIDITTEDYTISLNGITIKQDITKRIFHFPFKLVDRYSMQTLKPIEPTRQEVIDFLEKHVHCYEYCNDEFDSCDGKHCEDCQHNPFSSDYKQMFDRAIEIIKNAK